MKKSAFVATVAGALAAFGLLASPAGITKPEQNAKDKGNIVRARYAPDRVLVKFKDNPNGLLAQQARAQVEYLHALTPVRHFASIDVYVYRTPGPAEKIWKELRRSPNVDYAEPDYLRTTTATFPNDPSFNQLWGLHNTGQTGGTADADIDAPEAWDLVTGSSGVIVGVIDSGVDYTHSDLGANMWANPGEVPANGVDDDANGYIDDVYGINSITGGGDPMDDNAHGTHCSGTIAGAGNNGIGVAGVCWTARIMALKFLDATGSGYTSDAIECIEYSIDKGAQILSNSWGGGGYSQALKDAIDAAGASGILFVAAAGNNYGWDNDGGQPNYPSSYASPNIIAVASTDASDGLSAFSNIGRISVDVAAPGSAIYSTVPGNSYASYSGTSMATPHVSGLAALLKSYNSSLSWMQIKNRILGGAEPKAALQGKVLTGARINAYNSLVMADVDSYQLSVQSTPSTGVLVQVSPVDLDGSSSGTTNFTRRYAPYTTVQLTAPPSHLGNDFGFWTLEGSRIAGGPSISLPMDYHHAAVAHYLLPLGEAIDNTAMEVVTGGYQNGWLGQGETFYYGNDAAQSGDIGDYESGYMQTSVYGPGTLSFYWKVSSEGSYDFLSFFIDGTVQNSISGEVGWQQMTYSIGAGLHVLQWVFSKDVSLSYGGDCGWVDYVQFSGTPATLAQALDQEGAIWKTGGNGGWYPQAAVYQHDSDAAQSSDLLDDQEAYLETTVTGPTPVSFYWKVSSEAGYDFLEFSIDGVPQNSISGEVDWQLQTYSLGTGPHVLRWVYSKDSVYSSGSDCGWVDYVAINPSDTYTLTLQASTVGGGSGGTTDPPPDTYAYPAGEQASATAIPNPNYRFSGWTGDVPPGHSQDNPLILDMIVNRTVAANFIRQYNVTIGVTTTNGANGGTTDPAPGVSAYDVGTELSIAALPATDYRFNGWTGDLGGGQNDDNPLDVVVDADKSVTVHFLRIIYEPQNLDGEQAYNRSLFLSEYINSLTWSDSPSNASAYLTITKYRIYQITGQGKALLDEVPAGVHFYWHRDVEKDGEYVYGVCAVNEDGREGDFGFISFYGSTVVPGLPGRAASGTRATAGRTPKSERPRPGRHDDSSRSAILPGGPAIAFQGERDTSGSSIVLTWNPDPGSADVRRFRIYVGRGVSRTLLAEVGADELAYVHQGVASRTTYSYMLVPVDGAGREGRAVLLDVR